MTQLATTIIIFLLIVIALALLAISGNIHKLLTEPRDRQNFLNLLKISCAIKDEKRAVFLIQKYARAFFTENELMAIDKKISLIEILNYLKGLN